MIRGGFFFVLKRYKQTAKVLFNSANRIVRQNMETQQIGKMKAVRYALGLLRSIGLSNLLRLILFSFAAWNGQNLFAQTPTIVQQPAGSVRTVGESAQFFVLAGANSGLTYQWYKEGVAIPGQVSSIFNIPSVQISDGGSYYVVVSGTNGSVKSNTVNLTVSFKVPDTKPPFFSTQPQNQTVKRGSSVRFEVAVTISGAVSYQWLKNNEALPGATQSAFLIESVSVADAGFYKVAVFGSSGGQVSQTAELIVDERIAPQITVSPQAQTNTLGSIVQFSVEAIGFEPMRYQWLKDGFQLGGKTNRTIEVGPLIAPDRGVYTATVKNDFGQVTSNPATLTVRLPPTITSHPANVSALEGGAANFAASATGDTPFSYQWFKGGLPVFSATNQSFTLAALSQKDVGTYQVQVANTYGSVLSSNAVLTVHVPPRITLQPLGHTVYIGTNVVVEVKASGEDPLGYQWFKSGVILNNATNEILKLQNVGLSDAGSYRAKVTNPFGSAESLSVDLRVNIPLLLLRQPSPATVYKGADVLLLVGASGIQPIHYQWFKEENPLPWGTNATLQLKELSPADAGRYSVSVSNSLASAHSSEAVVVVQTKAAIIEPPKNQTVLAGSDATFEVLAEGDEPLSFQWRRMGTNLPSATNRLLTLKNVRFTDSALFRVVVSNAFEVVVSEQAWLDVDPRAVVLRSPVDQTAYAGTNIVLETVADGELPIFYEWQVNGTPIPGATNSTLVLSDVQVSDSGSYRVRVSNRRGNSTSSEAVVKVRPTIYVNRQPENQTVLEGKPLHLQIEAGGLSLVRYQWFLNGVPIISETNSAYRVDAAAESDAGFYTVLVENEHASLLSLPAEVRVAFPGIARGDFDGDGAPEIVFESELGQLAAWFMGGTNFRFARFFSPDFSSDPAWKVVGSGDFDLDGNVDLLFEHRNGSLAVWLLEGTTLKRSALVAKGRAQGEAWKVVAVADFNADGKTDVLFQLDTGGLVVWFLDRLDLITATFFDPLRSKTSGWRVMGGADFDRDGGADLILQHTDGSLALWYLKGASLVSGELLSPSDPGDPDWRVVSLADRNNDGRPDLLFQHATTGQLAVWFMERNVLRNASLLNPSDTGTGWRVVAP